ncbi:hypothetical protein RHABOEDO_000154 [Candidatus Rhabdochlamydia oedothoracis]|uniref:Outer membrane protein beta-barrel domain-containing protein n=1 Tax=Candidatus Rhabdochlamydia oedothoracis TaxID=2720720 RepID=A0ABX8UYL8_9BACT|nr:MULTISPECIES: acyloxyacyl hydrolase [Rhabdochlamydia]KAG6559402.1 hypothetical protein RHOW815_000603 [Candidatus Rhabdochlamydia sp. W815]MCL6756130.1 acyloxyacyl hydrolase [Candidatus Rhabdochlamydia oedothoracis]QYF48063.1 hypothetical protein RHABOEDO_000154 [Candidatus Rhabdochlamydia oedothoracis]
MKKILKIVPAFLLVFGSLFANTQEVEVAKPIENSFGYVNVGMESLFSAPFFGVGYRLQKNQHGLDLSASIVCKTIDYTSCFEAKKARIQRRKANVLYNFFFFPNLSSQVYVGLGVGVNYIDIKRLGSILGFSPEIALGKQYNNKQGNQRFIQLQVSLPGLYTRSKKIRSYCDYQTVKTDLECAPLFTFTYGIGF